MKTKCAIRQKFLSHHNYSASASHPSPMGTLQALILYLYWPSMKADVKNYCDTCDACQHNKYPVLTSPGVFQPITIPNACCASISIDFVTGLPILYGPNSTLGAVDRRNKMANFIGDEIS